MTADIHGPTIAELLHSWMISLRGRRLSPRTIESYDLAARQLNQWLGANGHPTNVKAIGHRQIAAYLAEIADTRAAATAKQRYASLLQFFEWLVIEDEIAANPMSGKKVRPPQVPPQPVVIIEAEKLTELLELVHGSGFEDRRDAAILFLLADTGIRLGEISNLRVTDVDGANGVVIVHGKGSKFRAVPYSRKTAVALDRYLRARARHKDVALPWLWLGLKGRMSDSGISQMVRRRGSQVGIEGLHPHQFRHTFAHMWLAAGGQEGDLQRIAGWADRQMLGRYGASAAHQRALDAHEKFSPVAQVTTSNNDRPLLIFRCVVDGCKKPLAGLFLPTSPWSDADIPVLGLHYGTSGFTARDPGHPRLPEPESSWWKLSLPLDKAAGLSVRCRIHGVWDPTAQELQNYWDAFRSGGPSLVRMVSDGPGQLRPREKPATRAQRI